MAQLISRSTSWDCEGDSLRSKSFRVDVQSQLKVLLAQEDINGDGKITFDDKGPKSFRIRTTDRVNDMDIEGTYYLSNLLQELTLAANAGQTQTNIQGSLIAENPVDRISRRIKNTFWSSLTRQLDESLIHLVANDPKDYGDDPRPRVYVPNALDKQYRYYQKLALQYPALKLEVNLLPPVSENADMLKIRKKPGILALGMRYQEGKPRGLQYVVPGGRFNEFYYWDSHFAAIGLLDAGYLSMVEDIVQQMIFQIEHYGCVLNANRSYYLGRSQPPFLTDLVLRTYKHMLEHASPRADEFLQKGILAAIKEYHHVWMSEPRLDHVSGLSRYRPTKHGIPPEVEPGHFDWLLGKYASKHGLSIRDLDIAYNSGLIVDAELDNFFLHDAAVRESGHDTSYRVEGQAADLATIDLQCLMYKYETDIGWAIKHIFNDDLSIPTGYGPSLANTSDYWTYKSSIRRDMVNKLCWNEDTGMFHDYNTAQRRQTPYESLTTFWSMWSGLASKAQAETLVHTTLPKFEELGGAVSTVKQPVEQDGGGPALRQRQWDHPFGWAPHQMLLWDGLIRYGYNDIARRLAYKWVFLLTKIAVDNNGMITERYDVTRFRLGTDEVVEYGNQGVDFRGVPLEGFGWSNASYTYGLTVVGDDLMTHLRKGTQWEDIPQKAYMNGTANGAVMNGH